MSKSKMFFNLWIVFLISGFWHGAAWAFVFWGAFHGFFLIADRLFLLKFYKAIGKVPSMIITYFIVIIGWVFFRAEDITYAWHYIIKMFSFNGSGSDIYLDTKFFAILLIAVLFSFFGIIPGIEKWQQKILAEKQRNYAIYFMISFSVIFLIICIASITSSGFNPFIYFRF